MPAAILPLGPCVIDWDDGAAVFQKTFGGVKFTYEELQQAIKEDQVGLTDTDDVTTGVINPLLEAPFTNEELDKLVLLFGHATEDDNLEVANPVGEARLTDAKQVIVKPIINGVISSTESEWLYIYKAVPRVTLEYIWDNENQRGTKVLFKGYPTTISGVVGALFRLGSPHS